MDYMTPEVEYKIIAGFRPERGDPEGLSHQIYEFFIRHHIHCAIHGSRIWAITVPPEKADEAVKLLKKSGFRSKVRIFHRPPPRDFWDHCFGAKKLRTDIHPCVKNIQDSCLLSRFVAIMEMTTIRPGFARELVNFEGL